MEEMWSFVPSKQQQRWLWHAIDHQTREVLAPHKDAALSALMKLLTPFGIQQFYTDNWGAYSRQLTPNSIRLAKPTLSGLSVSTYLTLRTRIKRLARKKICCSKSVLMHDTVIGLFINRYEVGRAICSLSTGLEHYQGSFWLSGYVKEGGKNIAC